MLKCAGACRCALVFVVECCCVVAVWCFVVRGVMWSCVSVCVVVWRFLVLCVVAGRCVFSVECCCVSWWVVVWLL